MAEAGRVQKRNLQALVHQALSGRQFRCTQVEVLDPVVPTRSQAVQDESHRRRPGIWPSKNKDHTAPRRGTVKLECHPYIVLQAEFRQRIEIAVQQVVLYTHEFPFIVRSSAQSSWLAVPASTLDA